MLQAQPLVYEARSAFGRWGVDPALDASRLRHHIGATVAANIDILRRYPGIPPLRYAGIAYEFRRGRDRSGGPVSDILTLLERGAGKCDSLVCYDVADHIVRWGVAASVFLRFEGVGAGQQRFHALTLLPGGKTLDPSRELGMP